MQDSDTIYTTNQIDIVNHARYCTEHYPTIVNLIPMSKNIYNSSLKSFALIDNNLAAAQNAIGQSSNLAQLALTYTYNYSAQKYSDYVNILAVLAQCSIDNAKRSFDVDIPSEIERIKKDINIPANGLPVFWKYTKKDKRTFHTDEQRIEAKRANKAKIMGQINYNITCPMNYVANLSVNAGKRTATIPIKDLFIKHEQPTNRRASKKVEELIENLTANITKTCIDDDDNAELFNKERFQDVVNQIRQTYISKNYADLMAWLINRAFKMSNIKEAQMQSNTDKNRSILTKVLYHVNPECFLSCFVAQN